MELQIFHTVNAGLYLWNGRSGLLVDALHDGRAHGFSATPQKYLQNMERKEGFFGRQNDLLFTHEHPDHYDGKLVDRFLSLYPSAWVYGPRGVQTNLRVIPMEAEADRIQIRDYQIYSFATRHDGKQYLRVPHRSYLIQWKDDLVWISGDAVFKPEFAVKVKNFCVSRNIAAAFANLYQMESLEGLRFLEALSPGLLCLYHLPFPEDDACHYHRMAKTVLDRRKKAGYQILQIMPEQQLRVSHGCARISR